MSNYRHNLATYSKRVGQGESFTVVKRSRPIFCIAPVDEDDDGKWETVIDFTKFRKNGISSDELFERLKSLDHRVTPIEDT